ncbi:MAG: 30S ribosomal protein S16 [Planctomycetia bacterium]|nr:30S ribosomal protein S16 [Planctomycetia bacterium]
MAVRIRMKRIGRKHRPFFRICATDSRAPRDGRVIETLGTYDPLVADTDARVTLNNDRIDYWLSVGALPSDRVKVLIKKYGTKGKRSAEHKAAREKLVIERSRRQAAAGKAVAEKAAPA